MKIIALITARGGSKRVPNKNLRLLGQKSLIERTVEVAKNSSLIFDIILSTDDIYIADKCKELDIIIPWLRPSELSSDSSSSVDVAIHAIDWYESIFSTVDGLLLLQPTSPFRTINNINDSIEIFRNNPDHSVVSVSPVRQHPEWMFKMSNNKFEPYLINNKLGNSSQNLETLYIPNGSIYIINPINLRENKSFYKNVKPYIIESYKESIDIDTEEDLKIAQLFLDVI
jgi:N-acylneuraminate cytidylyltransferase